MLVKPEASTILRRPQSADCGRREARRDFRALRVHRILRPAV